MAMKKGLKARWVAALRSGKYKQARKVLKRQDGKAFCCLGVLCDISPAVKKRTEGSEVLGHAALEYAGFSSSQEAILIGMNDQPKGHQHRTFRGIATWIENNL